MFKMYIRVESTNYDVWCANQQVFTTKYSEKYKIASVPAADVGPL